MGIRGAGLEVAGIGDADYRLAFCVANRPALDDYPTRNTLTPMVPGELQHIVANTSNHWRKLFNVYAKFLYALGREPGWPATWQEYRDHHLLQAGSKHALLFSPPPQGAAPSGPLHIIAGKGYAESLKVPGLHRLDPYFAIAVEQRVIVSPYLDYRQLSNERIERLVSLIRQNQFLV